MTENVKTVKVAKVGDRIVEVAVSENMTVGAVLESAGYAGFEGTIHAKSNDDTSTYTVTTSELVNGYDALVLSVNVKGGNY